MTRRVWWAVLLASGLPNLGPLQAEQVVTSKARVVDLSTIRRQVMAYVDSLQVPGRPYGCYRDKPNAPPSLYAACDVAILRTIMGEDLKQTVPEPQRKEWIDYINSFADEDGTYHGGKQDHSRAHANGMVIGALGPLGGRQKYPVRLYDALDTPEKVGPWLEKVDWCHQWGGSHFFWGGMHCFSMSRRCTQAWLSKAFEWLDANLDPNTGWWRKGVSPAAPHEPLGGGAHIWPIYQHHNHRFPYPERVIDSILEIQKPDGSWLGYGNYMELDALYGLACMKSLAPDYRKADVASAVSRHGDRLVKVFPDYLRRGPNVHVLLGVVGTFGLLRQMMPEVYVDIVQWTDIFSDVRLYQTDRVEVAPEEHRGTTSSRGPQASSQLTLYVALSGNDAWSGRLASPNAEKTDGPFASLRGARDGIRRLKTRSEISRPVSVLVRGGVYTLPEKFKLEARDSGTAEAPIIYRACQNEKSVITGGRPVRGFVPHNGKILKADLGSQGLKGVSFRQLFYDGKRQPLARYPNEDPNNPCAGGWAYVDGKPIPMYQQIPDESKRRLHYKSADARTWARPEEGEVFIFPRYNWWNNIVGIASVDSQERLLNLKADCSYAIRPGDRYYIRGLLEELDAPGEWYLDRSTWTLYFWPPEDIKDKSVYAPVLATLLELGAGTHHVTVRGFTFECCEGTAISLNNTQDCLIAGNVIRNVGGYHGSAVGVNGGVRNGVVGNDIYEVGSSAIGLSGGDRKTLTPAGNYADNNYVHHFGVYYKQGVGVSLSGVGNRASHNLIHDGPRFGIMFSGNNLVIEYNHIRHVDLETADTGAIYTGGRDWLGSRGTVIRYNFFHDVLGFGQEKGRWVSPHFCWGIYLDDNTGGVDVIGNIVARCVRGPIHLHNGRDNLIENNIFIDGKLQQVEYSGWTDSHRYWVDHLPTMIKGYESVASQPAWRTMRNMHLHPKDAVLPDRSIMSGNTFRRNIVFYHDPQANLMRLKNVSYAHNRWEENLYWHQGLPLRIQATANKPSETVEWNVWKENIKQEQGSLAADPLFVDPARDDYRLKPDSPALKLGFKPIPVEKIGPYQDERRASWPIVEVQGARERPFKQEK